MGCAGRGQAAGRTAETQSSKSTSSSSASSSFASTVTPRRSPGPWFLAGAPSKLSIRPALTSTRPPRCNDFQLFERLKLSAGLGAYPPYCLHRLLCSGVPTSRIAHHVVGERFGASRNVVLPRFFLAHRLGRPLERSEIAWGCLWVRLGCARGQTKSLLIEIHGFLPFSARRCALVPIPVHPPDLSRPLRGPYESPRPNPRVQANDGANPYGGCRPLRVTTVPRTTNQLFC